VGHPGDGPRIASSEGAALPQGDGVELVRSRCMICHGMDAPSLPRQDHSGWTETVDRMIANGAELNEEERAAVIEYLASR